MRSPLRALASLVKTPVPFTPNSGGLHLPWRPLTGAEAQMRAMGSVGTLFAIVHRTSNATAQVEWKLWRKAASGLDEDRTEVTSHAALDLWNKPNPFMPRQELVETFQQHVDLTGEGWLVLARNPRSPLPLELWPVRPDRIQPIPHPTEFLTGYMYTGPGGEQVALRREDVIQLRMPNPLDPYRGMGPVQSILPDLDANRLAAEWIRNFFHNSAEPGGIIEVPNGLSDADFDELRDRWNEQHRGVANAHRVAILEHGVWKDRKYTQRDMQFVELREVSSKVIREAFGIPKFAVGDVEDINRATADASKAWFAEQLTVPRLERIKAALNNDLLPLYGKAAAAGLEFDYCDPVPADPEVRNAELIAKTQAAKALIDAGFYPPQVLDSLGLPEIAHGQPGADLDRELLIELVKGAPAHLAELILPLLGFDLPEKPAALTQPTPPTDPAPTPAPAARLDIHHHATPDHVEAVDTRSLFDLARARRRRQRTGSRNQAGDGDLEDVREGFAEALAALLQDWEPVAEDQYEELAAQIEQAVDDADPEALASLTAGSDDAATVLRRALGAMATAAAEQMTHEAAAQGVEVAAPRVDPGLTDRLPRVRAAFGHELVDIAVAVAHLLAADVATAAGREALRLYSPGAVGATVADAVTGWLRGLKGWFRRDQLGGALHRAQNVGRLATLEAAPPGRYFATEVLDSNTCPPCDDIDGTEFTTLAEARQVYGTGGYQECEGGIRCRGTVVARWETEDNG